MTTLVTRENLEGINIKDLKAMAKENNVKGYSKMNKAELVDVLHVVLNAVTETSDETKVWAEEHKGEDHPDTFPPRAEENVEVKEEEKEKEEEPAYAVAYREFYKMRSTKIRIFKKVWGGKERERYECGNCGSRIGNLDDCFCYHCGWRFDGTDMIF